MKTDKVKKEVGRSIMCCLLLLMGTSSEAMCLKECQNHEGQIQPANKISFRDSHDSFQASNSFNRTKSPDISSSKNTMTGDIYLQVGHQQMKIDNSNSANSSINASVTSVINLGDTGDTQTTNNNYGERK